MAFRMSQENDNDIHLLFQRLNARLDQQRNSSIALNGELSQVISMQNRLIRDMIAVTNRLRALEAIVAYRTNRDDENDPLNRAN